MEKLPQLERSPVLRVDFSNDNLWDGICAAMQEPSREFNFRAQLDFIDNPNYEGISVGQILALVPQNFNHSIVFVVDELALSHPERPVLVVDLYEEPGRTFRVIPAEVWGLENNLSIANMDFADFADHTDADGIFRGIPRP